MSDRLLVDTSVVIWTLEGSARISARAKRELLDASKTLIVSVVSLWEMALKHQAAKLQLGTSLNTALDHIIRDSTWTMLPMTSEHISMLSGLPPLHKDPFDRMLIAQAQYEGLTIVTPDQHIRKYNVPTLW